MDGREHALRELGLDELAPLTRDAEVAAEQRLAAVAPRQTSTRGSITSSSASSQGRQAAISDQFGFWWMRRFRAPAT